jgi:hypothetical protein
MPTIFIEAPTGIRRDPKKRLVEMTTATLVAQLLSRQLWLRKYLLNHHRVDVDQTDLKQM